MATLLIGAILAAGCAGEPPSGPSNDAPAPQSGEKTPVMSEAPAGPVGKEQPPAEPERESVRSEQGNAGFATPKAAMETFCTAAAARDLESLSRCFADNAPREFDGLRQKTATPEELDELAGFMHGASVTDVRINESAATAVVDVKLSSRNEHISMRKTDTGWKIVDF